MHIKELINPEVLLSWNNYAEKYTSNKPYPHIVIDNFFRADVAEEIAKNFPTLESGFWYEYNNPVEKKFASDDIRKFPPAIAKAIHSLNSQEFTSMIQTVTGIQEVVESDPYLHGGGLHCSRKGGKLDIHVDYSMHPKLHMERRVNIIIYMTPNWDKKWGGSLEMWNGDVTKCENKVDVVFNRAVIFNTDSESMHGHPDPLDCPENKTRNSIALYYLTKPRENAADRPRARFFRRPSDPIDFELEEFREKRSKVSGVY